VLIIKWEVKIKESKRGWKQFLPKSAKRKCHFDYLRVYTGIYICVVLKKQFIASGVDKTGSGYGQMAGSGMQNSAIPG
jgi:hypothetical protein